MYIISYWRPSVIFVAALLSRHPHYIFSAYYQCIPVGVYKDLTAELVNLFYVFSKNGPILHART